MKILSIDTSSNICSVSLLENMDIILEEHIENEKTHSEKLMPMIKEVLEKADITLNQIDLFACSKGPGSFTGIRIGIASIKALASFPEKPVIGISSLEGLAYNIKRDGYIASILDARNDQVYFGLFERKKEIISPIGAYLADDIQTCLNTITPYIEKEITFVGDGNLLHQKKIEKLFAKAKFASKEENKASSISIGKAAYIAFKQGKKETTDTLLPLYLRKSSAERIREERILKQNGNTNS
ncbi:MAG: tRNA (adenosine(37)-N6)-threonylcarbamoyltransferase complex dimerization subunit type 1 TsaB [Clostridia bacterium]